MKSTSKTASNTTADTTNHWTPPSQTHGALWSRKRVEIETSMGRSWLYGAMAEGRFPRPVRIGSGRVAWVSSEVQQWIADRISERG